MYLYVRLPARSFPASRNSHKAWITSCVEYHKCASGISELFSWNKNLLVPDDVRRMRILSCSDMLDPECSDGSQSGNFTMKSVLWSCRK